MTEVEKDYSYDSLPHSSTAVVHMLAGAAAGLGEHCVMYPFDCVKTRMQSIIPDSRANYRGVVDALVTIFRYEGIRKTVRGINVVVAGAGPAHALYFACYEHLKNVFSWGHQSNHIAQGAAGCVSTLLHDIFMNPTEVIKHRMQMYGSAYRTCTECGQHIIRTEGFSAFYRSFTTSLSMNIPFQAVHFVTYEITQDFFNPTRQYDPVSHGMSGAIAGACSASVTMPLDVCKTLLNTQEHCSRTNSVSYITGIRAALQTVYEFQGIAGFFRGITARVLYQMPATAISWSVYEFFKFSLRTKDSDISTTGYLNVNSLQASSSK